ncbi:protein PAXX isoform X4 [Erinaceus europaeus]|uniref:Protein PAXX isoform X4 n=1 Tax=Erinaceus europaeus TaxID=9365 RepID=A0A1S3W9B8_ERIEU|nr:protein PAXX isoform X4 [Erinaceus europaeus]
MELRSLSPPLCTLPPGPGPPRFVCYCEGEGSEDGDRGIFNLYVTDAEELWSTCFTPDSLAAHVPGTEAAPRLQALTLGLAQRVCSLEQQLAEVKTYSPKKSSQLVGPSFFLPDLDIHRGGSGPGVKRRCPGESLINPGFKRYPPAHPSHLCPGSCLRPLPLLAHSQCHPLSSPSKKPAGGVDFDDP